MLKGWRPLITRALPASPSSELRSPNGRASIRPFPFDRRDGIPGFRTNSSTQVATARVRRLEKIAEISYRARTSKTFISMLTRARRKTFIQADKLDLLSLLALARGENMPFCNLTR